MADDVINIDEDPAASTDKRLSAERRTVAGLEVFIPHQVVVGGANHNKLDVRGDGSIAVVQTGRTVGATVTDTTASAGAGVRQQVLAPSFSRLGAWIFNTSAATIWVGAATVTANRGIPVAPGAGVNITEAPAGAWYVYGASAWTVAIVVEAV